MSPVVSPAWPAGRWWHVTGLPSRLSVPLEKTKKRETDRQNNKKITGNPKRSTSIYQGSQSLTYAIIFSHMSLTMDMWRGHFSKRSRIIGRFGQKHFFKFHAWVQNCHFGKIEKLPKWHFWTRAWKSKNFLAKSILLKHYENGNKKKYSQLVPGSAKSRIYSGKSTKRGFSKKGLARIKIFFLF